MPLRCEDGPKVTFSPNWNTRLIQVLSKAQQSFLATEIHNSLHYHKRHLKRAWCVSGMYPTTILWWSPHLRSDDNTWLGETNKLISKSSNSSRFIWWMWHFNLVQKEQGLERWLRDFECTWFLQRYQVQFPTLTLGGSQQPVSPVLREPNVSGLRTSALRCTMHTEASQAT